MAELVIRRGNKLPGLVIRYDQDASNSDYLPLSPNPSVPPPVIPVTGAGDMFRSVYDTNNNGSVDSVDDVAIQEVTGLQEALDDLAGQIGTGGGGGSDSFIIATNNGPDTLLPGAPVAHFTGVYGLGKSLSPRQKIIGLAKELSIPGQTLTIQTSGALNLTALEWNDVTGEVGGLAPDMNYYAKFNGLMSFSPPENSPEFLIRLGQALSSTKFLIDLDLLIQL